MGNECSRRAVGGPVLGKGMCLKKKDFENSQYKKELLSIEKSGVVNMEFHDVILQRLPGDLKAKYRETMNQHPEEKPQITAGRCWSLETPSFYGRLKGIIITDTPEGCKAMAPFMRALNMNLVCQGLEAMVTYRGSKMSAADLGLFKPGQLFRLPTYTATSKRKSVAKRFQNTYLLEFHIPKGCPNAGSLRDISAFKDEEEVLLPPYTAVKVKSINKGAEISIVLEVQDNRYVPTEVSAMQVNIANTAGAGAGAAGYAVTPAYLGIAGTAVAAAPMAFSGGLLGVTTVVGKGAVSIQSSETKYGD